jgi:hypothetical protein
VTIQKKQDFSRRRVGRVNMQSAGEFVSAARVTLWRSHFGAPQGSQERHPKPSGRLAAKPNESPIPRIMHSGGALLDHRPHQCEPAATAASRRRTQLVKLPYLLKSNNPQPRSE